MHLFTIGSHAFKQYATSYPFLFGRVGHFQHSSDLELEKMSGSIVQKRAILLWTNAPDFAQEEKYFIIVLILVFPVLNFSSCEVTQGKSRSERFLKGRA